MEHDMSDELEIEPLSDDDLEEVAGGQGCTSNSCSEKDCSGGGDDSADIDMSISPR